MSYTSNRNRNTFAADNCTAMQINQNYLDARRKGIEWLNSQKRDYAEGIAILTQSGYKSVVAAKLARQGEKPHTREKLEYEIRQMLQVWYDPTDPVNENVDLDDDAEPGNDGRAETLSDDHTEKMLQDTPEPDGPTYPPVIEKVIYTFRDLYNERDILHKELASMPETNQAEVVAKRKDIAARIAGISQRMMYLHAIRDAYEKEQQLPSDEALDKAFAKEPEVKEEEANEEDEDDDISSMSVEELKKAKANAKSKITKAKNMLLYSSESKQEQENPLPDSPKRLKYEKKIANQEALVERIDYRLAELS